MELHSCILSNGFDANRNNYKYNSDKVDKSPVPWWLNEDIKSEPATPEEQAEMERMIREITGEDSDSDEW